MTNMTQVKFFDGDVFRDRGYVSAVVRAIPCTLNAVVGDMKVTYEVTITVWQIVGST